MKGGIEAISDRYLLEMSAEIELQLEKTAKPGMRPVALLLKKARDQAAAALVQLCIVDPTDAANIRILQNEIIRFDDQVKFCREILNAGKEIDRKMRDEEREDMRELVSGPQWAAAEARGFTQGADS